MLSFKEFLLLEGTSYDAKLASMKNKHGEIVQEYFEKIETLLKQQDNVLWFLQFLEQNLESLKEVDDLIVQFKDHFKDYLDKVQFKGKNKSQVLTALENLYNKDKAKEDKNKGIEPQATDEILIKCESGNSWWFVDRGFCSEEARSGNHCGNVVGKEKTDQRILSLRNSSNQVILTFILEPDNTLGEMKAKGNLKPSKDYHADIMELLTHKPFTLTKGSKKENFQISGISGKGYLPHMNFSIFDLSEEDIMKIHVHNKKFITDQIDINPTEILGTSEAIKELYKDSLKPYIKKLIKSPSLDNWKNAIDKFSKLIIYLPREYWMDFPDFEKLLVDKLAYGEGMLLKSPTIVSKNFEILKKVIEKNPEKIKEIQNSYKEYNRIVEVAIKRDIETLKFDEITSKNLTPECIEYILKNYPEYSGKIPPQFIPKDFNVPLSSLDDLVFPFRSVSSLIGKCPKKVGGRFFCSQNENLFSLEGAPEEVRLDIAIENNSLTSLKFGPKIVGRNYNCNGNKLISLEGCPKIIPGYFNCVDNLLTNLKDGPEKVGKSYNCSDNKLTSLEGCQEEIKDSFICSNNINLHSLEYGPKIVRINYSCSNCGLTSLKGSPEIVGTVGKASWFNCDNNQIESLEGMPKIIFGDFYCENNSKKFTEKDVRKYCEVHGNIYL